MELVRYPSPIQGKQEVEAEPELALLKKRVEEHDKVLTKLSQDVVDIRTENQEIKKIAMTNLSNTHSIHKFGIILIILGLMQMTATVWWAGRTESTLLVISERLSNVENSVASSPESQSFPAVATSYIKKLF
jgi:hypothetical protein